MILLALSTSSQQGSVAIVRDDELVGRRAYEGEMQHAERLFGVLDELLVGCGLERGQLGAVACDVGPGSFTGVRAGLAAAKGIALGLSVPLWGVSSLAAMAEAAAADPRAAHATELVCLLDAKRAETFFAIYDGQRHPLLGPAHVRTSELGATLGERVQGRTLFVGRHGLSLSLPPSAIVLSDGACALPDAEWIGRLAITASHTTEPCAPASVEVIYLRAPDAVPRPTSELRALTGLARS